MLESPHAFGLIRSRCACRYMHITGFSRRDLTARMYADDGAGRQRREAMLARISLGRRAEPEDFMGTLLLLLSRASDFCTGQVIYVDRGYRAP